MNNFYLNKEQQDYVNYLRSISNDKKCWCGWYELGKCPNGCPTNVTAADKVRLKCKKCGNAPHRPGMKLVHIINCPESLVT